MTPPDRAGTRLDRLPPRGYNAGTGTLAPPAARARPPAEPPGPAAPPDPTADEPPPQPPPGPPAPPTTEPPDDERLARAALTRVAEPDDRLVRALVREVGPVEAWELIRRRDPRLPDELLGRTAARVRSCDPARDLDRAARVGGRFVCPGDAEWPAAAADLARLPDPRQAQEAYGLWLRGPARLDAVLARAVAVVGSRAATAYGAHVAGEIAAGLADRGWTVVSGGAYGVDGAAHRGAVAAGGETICVLASGVDVAYPRGHADLFARIAAEGLIVSEWPPGCAPHRHRFLSRNRLIAAFGRGTVLVEAAHRSGALNTVRWARQLNRVVMAVPGPVTSVLSTGCHRLIREPDGVCVTDAAEVVEAVGAIGDDLAPLTPGPARARDALGAEAQRLLDGLPARAAATPDALAASAGLPIHRAVALLDVLEDDGWVERTRAGYRLGPRARLDGRSPHAAEYEPPP